MGCGRNAFGNDGNIVKGTPQGFFSAGFNRRKRALRDNRIV